MENNNKNCKRKIKLVHDTNTKNIIFDEKNINIHYFKYLLKKYCLSNGISFDKKNINIDDFIDWVYEYKKQTRGYAEFLTSYNIDLNAPSLAEVGKGKIDSIIGPEAIEISDFSKMLSRPKIIFGDVEKGLIIQEDRRILTLDDLNIDRLITQNPNFYSEVDNFGTFANKLNKAITFGVYGSFSDKDIENKNKMIKRLLESTDDTIFEYDTLNDYFYMAVTTRNTKAKSKSLSL